METTPAIISDSLNLKDIVDTLPRLEKGREMGIAILKDITKVTRDTREEVIAKLAKNRDVTEKINAIRSPLTKKLDEFKQGIMQYEKATQAEHDRVKKLVSDFDQIELEITRKAQAKAAHELEITTYKATLKESVGKAVVGMVGGQVRNIIDGMSKWQAGLTLENIDKKGEDLKAKKIELKRESYDACFLTEFPGKRNDLLDAEVFTQFMDSMRKEFSYEKVNEDYMRQVAPIINEYRAKLPSIKEELSAIKASPTAADLEAKRKQDIADKAWEELTKNQKATEAKVLEVVQTKDKEIMEGEFVKQGTLDGMEMPLIRRIPEFEDINLNKWVKPFLEIVAKCAVSPKFKLVKKTKAEYIDAVQWWMDFYAVNMDSPIDGIKITESAKTVIRKSKEEI